MSVCVCVCVCVWSSSLSCCCPFSCSAISSPALRHRFCVVDTLFVVSAGVPAVVAAVSLLRPCTGLSQERCGGQASSFPVSHLITVVFVGLSTALSSQLSPSLLSDNHH